jgi:hypothetical protein
MIALLTVVAGVAIAQGEVPVAGTSGGGPAPVRRDHEGQFGLSFMPAFGYRMIARYNEEQICLDATGPDSKWVCTSRAPVVADLGLSFGASRRLDVIADLRFGLERERAVGVGRQFAFAPGVRFWLERERKLKFYSTVQVLLDHTAQGQDWVDDTDYGFRNANGVMYDPDRRFGIFFQLGETLGFVRWFRIEVDVGLGVQVRLP